MDLKIYGSSKIINYKNPRYESGLNIWGSAKLKEGVANSIIFEPSIDEGIADLFESVLVAIRRGSQVKLNIPQRRILFPSDIDNYYERVVLNKFLAREYPLLEEALGVVVDTEVGGLKPLTANQLKSVSGKTIEVVFHTGLVSNLLVEMEKEQPAKLGMFDNLQIMSEFGVFGCPHFNFLTYVRPSDSMASGMSRKSLVVRFEIELSLVPEQWPIYHNIEMWKDWNKSPKERPSWAVHDIPYASYGILGGIPVRAITKIELATLNMYED